MSKAYVKGEVLFIEVPFSTEGRKSVSGKSTLHATTEPGTDDAISIKVNGKDITVQVNAYSRREKAEK